MPKARLKVFSSLAVYERNSADDPFQGLYERCRQTEGVEYVGSVSQTVLATELKRAWCLAYPSTFAETACISAMEAMAAGCRVVTTHLGALGETTQGYARLVIPPAAGQQLATRFAAAVVDVLGNMDEDHLRAAVNFANREFDWKRRAKDFGERLARLLVQRPDPSEVGRPPARRVPPPLKLVHGRRGTFLINANDDIGQIISLYGEWAEPEAQLLLSTVRPGATVIDVGAHVGADTVPLARAVGPSGRVYSFEPQAPMYRLLVANVALNGLEQVETFQCLVGAEDGTRQQPPVNYDRPGNFGAVTYRHAAPAGNVRMVRLDTTFSALPRCALLKIDVEGMEPEVIRGAMDLIRRCRPIIYCEANRADAFRSLIDLLRQLGYSAQWHCFRGYNPANYFGFGKDVMNGFGDANLVCLPRESGARFPGPEAVAFDDVHRLFPGILPK